MWKSAERFLVKDKYMKPLIKKYGKCTLKIRPKNKYFEELVDSIVSQQLSVKAAATIFGRLKEKVNGQVTPKNILKLRITSIRKCGLSYAKASYVKDLAKYVESGKLKLDELDKLQDKEVMDELISVKGIGRWTAEMFLMFSLARADIFPVDDVGIQNGLKNLTGKQMKKEKMETLAQRWKPYRTVASWYIWRSLDN